MTEEIEIVLKRGRGRPRKEVVEELPKEPKKRGRPAKVKDDEPKEPKKRGRPAKEKILPPPKPPRIYKTHDPNYIKNYYQEKDYYRKHYAVLMTCPSCKIRLVQQKIARHLKQNQKCRLIRMEKQLEEFRQQSTTTE
jgi:ssDNA-specific exonuclease RecJ